MYLGNVVGLIVVLTTVPLFAAILRMPFSIIAPVIIVICAIGAYTVHSAMLDVWLMLGFGVIGYVFKKLDYPLARWCSRWCLATRPRTRSGSPCSCRKATWRSCAPTRWSASITGAGAAAAVLAPAVQGLGPHPPPEAVEFSKEQPID